MDKLYIPCYFAIGYAGEDHAWNIVKIGEKFYNIDLTFDDPVENPVVQQGPKSGLENYEYFLRGDGFFENPDPAGIAHTKYNLKNIKAEKDYMPRPAGKPGQ